MNVCTKNSGVLTKFADVTASAYDTPDGTDTPVTMKFVWE